MRWIAVALSLLVMTVAAPPSEAQHAVTLRFLPRVEQVGHYRLDVQPWVRLPGLAQKDPTQPLVAAAFFIGAAVLGYQAWHARQDAEAEGPPDADS